MTSYTSIGAYKIAMMVRSAKTILVEGETDASLLNRLILERALGSSHAGAKPVVDRVDLIKDQILSGMGNRQRVLKIAEAVGGSRDKFRGFVDKEWHGYDFVTEEVNNFLECDEALNSVMLTKGHSIENYFFDHSYYREFILRNFGDRLPHAYFEEIPKTVDSGLLAAFVLSAGARKAELIERCSGLISKDMLESTNAGFSMNIDLVIRALKARQVSDEKCEILRSECERVAPRALGAASYALIARWAVHGHIGDAVIWAALAKLATVHGLPAKEADQIECGQRREKFLDGAQFLARREENDRVPIDRLLSWAQGRQPSFEA
ncbi:DUF4435 domain-containing protein [Paraburkholderia sp. Se-20369]|nr:DUF4435 domain-containing protein [Paraburkholderia sp. Se-20369]